MEFNRPVKIQTNLTVESWLKAFETAMIETIKKRIRDAVAELNKQDVIVARQEWVLKHCGQAIAVASMLDFTQQVDTTIEDMDEDPFALGDLLNRQVDNLMCLVELIRGTDLS